MDILSLVLSIIGAAAWVPIIINSIIEVFRKIHYVYLDRKIISDVVETKNVNGTVIQKKGMNIILGLNLFVYGKPYFPHQISCEIVLKDGPVHTANNYEGTIRYTDTIKQPNNISMPIRYVLFFPFNVNANVNRAVHSNIDNVRILPFFIENLNLQSDDNIKYIKIKFKGRFFTKSIILNSDDCVNIPIIDSYRQIDNGVI